MNQDLFIIDVQARPSGSYRNTSSRHRLHLHLGVRHQVGHRLLDHGHHRILGISLVSLTFSPSTSSRQEQAMGSLLTGRYVATYIVDHVE